MRNKDFLNTCNWIWFVNNNYKLLIKSVNLIRICHCMRYVLTLAGTIDPNFIIGNAI